MPQNALGASKVENKKKKRVLNIVMIALIIAITIGGVAAVGHVKGWFADDKEKEAVAVKVTGIVNIQRDGISFELKEGACVEDDDIISTNDEAGVIIEAGRNTYEFAEKTSAVIENNNDRFGLEITGGEIFGILNGDDKSVNITAQNKKITSKEGVFSVNVQTGSMGINVFSGEVKVFGDEKEIVANSGEAVSIIGDDIEVMELKASSLNKFNIDRAIEASNEHKLCFSNEELKKVLEDRDRESNANLQENEEAQGQETDESSSSKPGKNPGNSSSQSNGNSGNISTNYDYSCTIEIRCDTILNNMADLKPGKAGYVPSNGMVLRKIKVGFNSGETVFDVLNRVCKEKGIQIEYSYSPMYGNSYIEGLNHIYEFDCGEQSGWMYKVNGWFPNYGCSSYTLSDGDNIVWAYTCKGLGEDLGASIG